MKPIELPSVSHFRNRNGWLGSAGVMRFEIETPQEVIPEGGEPEPDEEKKQYTADVVLWQGPFSRPYAQDISRRNFPMTEEGRAALLQYLDAQAEALNADPPFTQEETYAYYRQKKQEERENPAP